MATDPLQLTLEVLEYTLVFGGGGLVLWILLSARQRQRWLGVHALPQLSLSPVEFAIGAALIFLSGFVCNALVQLLLGPYLTKIPDYKGVQVLVINLANYGGSLIGWRVLLPAAQRAWMTESSFPPVRTSRPPLTWSEATGYGMGTLLVALPVVILISLAWLAVLRASGLPDAPQDLIADFLQTKSPFVVGGMLIMACILAPVYEELMFRAALYRFIRQKLGRTPALLVSGICFGAMHANWASFVPLAALGMLLALAYEATGSIRVPIVAHGLFNLHSIILLLAGFTPPNP
ncbi:MAG TPA: CPBP family intramembrane glutamic endopeptidase [Lacunisphaera sp.]|nr:CPBP family intramembrane glutamic endopeptidase [Lacunisphaera sp.]